MSSSKLVNKIMGLLLSSPKKAYTSREISDAIDETMQDVGKCLFSLSKNEKIFKQYAKGIGNARKTCYYSASPSAVIPIPQEEEEETYELDEPEAEETAEESQFNCFAALHSIKDEETGEEDLVFVIQDRDGDQVALSYEDAFNIFKSWYGVFFVKINTSMH